MRKRFEQGVQLVEMGGSDEGEGRDDWRCGGGGDGGGL